MNILTIKDYPLDNELNITYQLNSKEISALYSLNNEFNGLFDNVESVNSSIEYYYFGERINNNYYKNIDEYRTRDIFNLDNYPFFNDISIIENIKLICSINNLIVDEDDINKRINIFNLNSIINMYPKDLDNISLLKLKILIASLFKPFIVLITIKKDVIDGNELNIVLKELLKLIEFNEMGIIINTDNINISKYANITYAIDNNQLIEL